MVLETLIRIPLSHLTLSLAQPSRQPTLTHSPTLTPFLTPVPTTHDHSLSQLMADTPILYHKGLRPQA